MSYNFFKHCSVFFWGKHWSVL